MPVLRRSENPPGLVIEDDAEVRYALTEAGERFLVVVLNLHPGDNVRDKDLALLIDRGWATKVPPPAPAPVPPHPPARTESAAARPSASRRTRGREVALQVLYLTEQNPEVDPDEIERFLVRRLRDPKLVEYTRSLVDGVRVNLTQIDERIASVAENWRLDRMAAIDRNILRLGVYEMHFRDDIPVKVAINEALELAKRYSTAQSSRFVNGILDRLQATPDASTSAEPAPVPPSVWGESQAEGAPGTSTSTAPPPSPSPPARPGSPPLASRGVAGRASSSHATPVPENRPGSPVHPSESGSASLSGEEGRDAADAADGAPLDDDRPPASP